MSDISNINTPNASQYPQASSCYKPSNNIGANLSPLNPNKDIFNFPQPIMGAHCSPYPGNDNSQSSLSNLVSTLAGVVENLLQTFMTLMQDLMQKVTADNQLTTPSTDSQVTPTDTTPTDGTGQTGGVENKNNVQDLRKSGEFLWKPVSEKNKNLVVLLPSNISDEDKIKSVQILSPDGKKVLGKGKASGIANGDRAHYRFPKSGASYPDNCIVQIKLTNGNIKQVKIPETSRRFTR